MDLTYGSTSMPTTLIETGHLALIGPKPLAHAVAGGFSTHDSTSEPVEDTLASPNGLVRKVMAMGIGGARRRVPRISATGSAHHRTARP